MACQDQKQVFILTPINPHGDEWDEFLRLDSLTDDVFDVNNSQPTKFASGDDLIRNALSLTGLEAIAEETNESDVASVSVQVEPKSEKNKENKCKPVPEIVTRTRPKSQPIVSYTMSQPTMLTPTTTITIPSSPQQPVLTPVQLINPHSLGNHAKVFHIGPGGNLTPANQFNNIQQFVLQPLTPITTTSSQPRIIRLSSTPATPQFLPVNVIPGNQTPIKLINTAGGRRLSIQPQDFLPGNTIITTNQSILSPIVPEKTKTINIQANGFLAGHTSIVQSTKNERTTSADSVFAQIENDTKLTARERLIKMRKEMRKRYEMIREASEIKRDDTFKPYRATKLRGRPHPDPVIESIALSSVPVPDVTCKAELPRSVIDEGKLSDLQLEAVIYSKQQHAQYYPSGERRGFLLGDGAGVGKGRSIAGIIYDNWNQGRQKAIWLSVSNDLRFDSERDLNDIGASEIDIFPFNKFKYGHKLSDKENGKVNKGIIFGTYASLIGERHSGGGKITKGLQATRLHQLVTWCGRNFDGVIVFDECHKAKNLYQANGKPSKTGATVLELQRALKHARVVYASATGASEPKHMSYMSRLGLWGAGTGFKNSDQFIDALTKAGVGAMELVAMDMKRRGVYLGTCLSKNVMFAHLPRTIQSCEFDLEEVPLDLTFMTMYDKTIELWKDAKVYFQKAAALLGDDFKMPGMWQQFWGAHQRFFKYLTMAAKVPKAVQIARQAIRNNMCVIIGLQSTGEQRTSEEVDRIHGEGEQLTEMVSSCKGVFRRLLEHHFPVSDRSKLAQLGIDFGLDPENDSYHNGDTSANTADNTIDSDNEEDTEENICAAFGDDDDADELDRKQNKIRKRVRIDSMSEHFRAAGFKLRKTNKHDDKLRKQQEANEQCAHMLRTLLAKLEAVAPMLPGNALDELMDGLGGPSVVSEMTGRRNRLVVTDQGVRYENRAGVENVPLEQINLIEKEHFMQGRKKFAIISDAASSGISLHCDRRVPNQNRRLHLTLELPWSADKAVQQFGRSHRSNQVCPPRYSFLISELAGEQRFASVVARRLECMGALTHGDRRSVEKQQDLSRFNFDTILGKKSLDLCLKSILGEEQNTINPPSFYSGNFKDDMKRALFEIGLFTFKKDDDKSKMKIDGDVQVSKFLNRLLGIDIASQQALFQYFSDTLDDLTEDAKSNGTLEEGVLDVGNAHDKIVKDSEEVFSPNDDCILKLIKINHFKGVDWKEALSYKKRLSGEFYVEKDEKVPFLLYPKGDKFLCLRPNISIIEQSADFTHWTTTLNLKDEPIADDKAEKLWIACYQSTAKGCIHQYKTKVSSGHDYWKLSEGIAIDGKPDLSLKLRTLYCCVI